MKYNFTLLEIIMAMMILALGLVVALSAISMSRLRVASSARNLHEEQLLVQAAEYFLLTGSTDDIPENIFPYPDYTVSARTTQAKDLPSEVDADIGSFTLQGLEVELQRNRDGEVKSLYLERIIRRGLL